MSQLNFCQVHSRVGEPPNKSRTAVHSHVVLGVPSIGYVHPYVRTIAFTQLALAPLASGNTAIASAIVLAQRGQLRYAEFVGLL